MFLLPYCSNALTEDSSDTTPFSSLLHFSRNSLFSSCSLLMIMSLRLIISSLRQFIVEIMFFSNLASASLLTTASFLVRVLYSWVLTSAISEQVDRCNKKFKPSNQTIAPWNYTIQFTITTTGNTMTLVHIATIPFYISIYFCFRCVNCYYIDIQFFSNTFLQMCKPLWFRAPKHVIAASRIQVVAATEKHVASIHSQYLYSACNIFP